MQSNGHSKPSEKGFFNTLAQSATNYPYDTPVVLIGNGSEINDNRTASGRTKRKLITNAMILSLIDIAKELGDYEAVKQYWNIYHCQTSLISSGGKVYGAYCKNRICTVCSANRKADIINRYLPVLKTWDDAQFVTITIKSCSAKLLKYYLEGMLRTFRKINKRQNKRHERGTGIKLVGIRSLECNCRQQSQNCLASILVNEFENRFGVRGFESECTDDCGSVDFEDDDDLHATWPGE